MIQRIQTVYLALAAIALAATGFFNDPWASDAATQFGWFVPALIASLSLAALTGLGSISMYSNRKKQRKIVVWAQVLTVVYLVVLYTGFYLSGELVLRTQDGIEWETTIVLLLPVLAYILFYLARRAITSDIELVKSMDRLR
ncbi:hypothetical protein CRI94_12835 [Longibacter salinarum]|uniref:DUF4293 domain-containing protein n=1 Tax=Longibacter salinarum TaxID=1850348 RepID=A0A2A8CW88_9BACT|nr:DUF4293 family protein [Longibacter salinarum]PEN12883.1 hypothetical protein CRI94_12835 [Longibacter salinarum]